LIIGLTALRESILLILNKDPKKLYDPMGPGLYVLLLSIAILITSIISLFVKRKKAVIMEKAKLKKRMLKRVISMIVVLILYIYLINIVGYIAATMLFLVLEFSIVNVKFWPNSIILSLIITSGYYYIFVHYCEIVFPKGLLF
jgi:putative tricarboxylic transport membrane protein